MGSLILPSTGPVYADALIFIYSVEKHPVYAATLRPLWEAVARGELEVLSSELTLMETLIGPLKQQDAALETDYENFFVSPGIRLLPITSAILRAGANLRATLHSLRTPDAIQAATGHSSGCSLFITNDHIFRRIPGLPVVLLDDVLKS